MRSATALRADEGDLLVELSDGTTVRTAAVVLATGASYRRLEAPGVADLVGSGIFYSPAVAEAAAMGGQPVVVVGGGNSAGQAALHLSRYASRVTLLVRGASLAASMSEYLIRELRLAPNITIRYGGEVVAALGDEHLEQIEVRDTGTGATETLAAAGLFVLIGSQPGRSGCRRACGVTSGVSSSRAGRPAPTRPAERRRATPACSQRATSAGGRSSGSPPRSARARS